MKYWKRGRDGVWHAFQNYPDRPSLAISLCELHEFGPGQRSYTPWINESPPPDAAMCKRCLKEMSA